MQKRIFRTAKAAKAVARKKFGRTRKKIYRSINALSLPPQERSLLLALLGVRGRSERALWSDITVRYKAAKLLVSLMSRHRREAPAERNYYFVTLVDDCGTTSDRTPNLSITQMTQKVRRAIDSMGLNAFVMLEVHPLANHPGGGAGRSLLLHAHAIAWTDAPFDHIARATAMCASPAWNCTLGAKPIDIRPINSERGQIEAVSHYLMKQVSSAKNLMPDKRKPGQHILMDTTKGLRDDLALRIFEGQSQVELLEMTFGVGAGKAVRQSLRSDLIKWHRARSTPILVSKAVDVWALWHRVRQDHGSKLFMPYRFDGGAYKPFTCVVAPRQPTTREHPDRDADASSPFQRPRPPGRIDPKRMPRKRRPQPLKQILMRQLASRITDI